MLHAYREHWPEGRPNPFGNEAKAAHAAAFQALGLRPDELDRKVRAFYRGERGG